VTRRELFILVFAVLIVPSVALGGCVVLMLSGGVP
jgi:hypothetical protein